MLLGNFSEMGMYFKNDIGYLSVSIIVYTPVKSTHTNIIHSHVFQIKKPEAIQLQVTLQKKEPAYLHLTRGT